MHSTESLVRAHIFGLYFWKFFCEMEARPERVRERAVPKGCWKIILATAALCYGSPKFNLTRTLTLSQLNIEY